jgi:ribosomal protein S18 acetylase RimI-like enzyme
MPAVVSADEIDELRPQLRELVRDSVEDGASIGFVLPLGDDVLDGYVTAVRDDVARGTRIVVVAREGVRVDGMVHLSLVGWPNAPHRAELQKLLVHTRARRRGLATRLMADAERVALEHGRTLLVLDTITGTDAYGLYRRLGWTEVGEIPDYAAWPSGALAPTTVFFKQLA